MVARPSFQALVCAVVLSAGTVAGCAALGGIDDGTSLAYGPHNGGILKNGVRLPAAGDGWVIPSTWKYRGNNFGTEELVGLVVRASRRVAREAPGAPVAVADLADEGGGRTPWHRSHQTGLDVDICFFAKDAKGNPAPLPTGMYRYGEDGWTLKRAGAPRWQFDVERNWILVRALVEDPFVEIQYIFVSDPLRDLLLAHAEALGEPKVTVARARAVMREPEGALPHDDHFHVRIYCPVDDRALGCRDLGPLRWTKKGRKYATQAVAALAAIPEILGAESYRPFCAILWKAIGGGGADRLVAGRVAD